MKKITPRIKTRPLAPEVMVAARDHGYNELQARILAGRLPAEAVNELPRLISPTLRDLDGPDTLPDIGPATERIVRAIIEKEHILLASDFDADGNSASSVLTIALRDVCGHPADRIHYFTGHRQRDGYGVSDTLTDRIIASGLSPALVITADQGSNNHATITRLAQAGIDTVVTDHHQMTHPPVDAVACVSPARADSQFPDPHISGAHVAWLVCCAVRSHLIKIGYLPASTPSLGFLIDVVSVSTISDATSLGRSRNNRAMVLHGTAMMNMRPRPAWTAIKAINQRITSFDAGTLGYVVAPMINAASRVDEARPALDLILSTDVDQAIVHAQRLHELNLKRREIEAGLRGKALERAMQQVEAGTVGLVIALEDGHVGVHGIVAARVVAATGRPAVCLSPVPGDPASLTGSVRSIPGVDARRVLEQIHEAMPGLQKKWGGHAAACGTAIAWEDLPTFAQAFDAGVRAQLDGAPEPVIMTDGELPAPAIQDLSMIQAIGPFGREYEQPVFTMEATVLSVAPVGDGSHLKLEVRSSAGRNYPGIWFSAIEPGQAMPVNEGDDVLLAYTPELNVYRRRTTLQLQISALTKK